MTEYLNYIGYGGQMLSVMADGSTIYPSALVEPTSRYDSGMFFEQAQDPVRKDGLELALRLFDRDGLKLIPTLQFSAPLPELEAQLRRGGEEAAGIELIGPEGKPYTEINVPRRGIGPYYNPLNPHVQEAMLNVVHELVNRYRIAEQHPSFGGLAIELTADGYTQLPGFAWPLDDVTLAEFQHDTGIQVPGEGPTRYLQRAAFLSGKDGETTAARQAWLNWRAENLGKFYRRLQSELIKARRDAVLYLAPTNLFDGPESKAMLRPTLPAATHADDVLMSLGIRAESFRDSRGLVLLRPDRLTPPGPLTAQAGEIEVNRATALDTASRSATTSGAILYHEPQVKRLVSFDGKNPFDKNKSSLWMISELSPADRQNRERFVHALATLDSETIFDGGWLLPLGQEDSLADLVAAYRRLPATRFETYNQSATPVTIRTLSNFNSTFAYLVNDSAWPVTVKLQLDISPNCRFEELSGRRQVPPLTGSSWTVPLQPFDFVAVRFLAPNAKIAQAEIVHDPKLRFYLEHQVADLQQRVASLVRPPELPRVANNSFEVPAKGAQVPGWIVATKEIDPAVRSIGSGTASIGPEGVSPTLKPQGKQAVRLDGVDGMKTILTTEPFPAPVTGRLSISVWLKVENPLDQPSLNFALKYNCDGKPYYPYAQLGKSNPQWNLKPQWSCFILPIDDLPATGVDKVQVQFELIGPGRVWIDDLQLKDLVFTQDEQIQLTKLVAAAALPLEKGKLSDCLSALDNYYYWLHFLQAYVPLPPQQVAGAPQPGDANQPPPGAQNPPANKPAATSANPIDRLKGLLR